MQNEHRKVDDLQRLNRKKKKQRMRKTNKQLEQQKNKQILSLRSALFGRLAYTRYVHPFSILQ